MTLEMSYLAMYGLLLVPLILVQVLISGRQHGLLALFGNREKGLKKALSLAKKDDLIIILGKGRENYQKIGNLKIHHSDLKIIRNFQ